MSEDVLPESRLEFQKGVVHMSMPKMPSNWSPIFCANCGTAQGYVPEENCTFVCWLCDSCASKWGTTYGLLLTPDEVFWQKVADEQFEKYGRYLTKEELQQVAQSNLGPLSALLKESPIREQIEKGL